MQQSVKVMIYGLALALMLSASAEAAKQSKKPKATGHRAAEVRILDRGPIEACRGAHLFHCGPIYNAYDYLGNDPDPFIRAMIQRDLGAKYGGSE